jgi:MoaA/NifB/PqqE/SkfB family radical SAM enzyme
MASSEDKYGEMPATARVGIMACPDPTSPSRLLLYDPLSNSRLPQPERRIDAAGEREWRDHSSGEANCKATVRSAGDAVFPPDLRNYFDDPGRGVPAWNLELTDLCTLSCRHCYQEPGKCEAWQRCETANGLTWEKLVGGLLACGVSEVSLTGGEVMLFPGLPEVLRSVRALRPDMRIRMLLSGMSIWRRQSFRELLPSLAEHHVLVKVPIYSCRAVEHDWVTRSPGSLADSLRLIEELQRSGVEVLVSYLMLRETQKGIMETCEFLRKLVGRDFVISTVVYPSRRSCHSGNRGSHLLDATVVRTLLQNEQFSAIAADYLSFQPPCRSGCRFPMLTIAGEAYGCTVCGPSRCGNVDADSASAQRANDWRPEDGPARRSRRCDQCFAQSVCKRCCCFVGSGEPEAAYCRLVRVCAEVVIQRVRQALAEGMRFLHEEGERRWEAWEDCVAAGEQVIAS